MTVRVLAALHLPAEDTADRCLLRDGSVVTVRAARPDDLLAMAAFFRGLSPESLYQRFFGAGTPEPRIFEPWCRGDSVDHCTLVATRSDERANEHFLGVSSYMRTGERTAEVAFATAEQYHSQGIATALLERLIVKAAHRGFERFRAWTLPGNLAMQDVFRQSGFQTDARPGRDAVAIELTLTPSAVSMAAAEQRERLAAAASIRPLFEPRGVAVVGASRNTMAIGRRVLDALLLGQTTVAVYPVHPAATEIAGLRAYRSVRDIDEPVELALIAIPRGGVLATIDDCAAKGVKAVVVISAGFAEVDAAGRELQRQLVDKCRAYGIRLVGPNCMGLVNTDPAYAMNASFSPVFPPAGGVALLSQSGAIGIAILALAEARAVGISSFVSVGNKGDVSGNDLIQYWESDPRTNVIGLYLESFGNPRRFARIASRVSRTKPVLVVKAGRSSAGLRAASSHTAALASRDIAVDALLRQCGAIRTDTIDEMFDVAACLATQPLPPGRRVAIVTNAGGPGILAADACELSGLEVADLADVTRAQLSSLLPGVPNPGNPADMIASAGPEAYEAVTEALLTAPEVDALMVLYTPVDRVSVTAIHASIVAGIARARAGGATTKAVVACLLTETGTTLMAGAEHIPVYGFPENAARALAKAADYAAWRRLPEAHTWTWDDVCPDRAQAVCTAALTGRGEGWLPPEEVALVLEAFGLRLTPSTLTRTADEAIAAARDIGRPVVAKLRAAGLIHKSDVGGVRGGLSREADVGDAFRDLQRSAESHGLSFEGVAIQPMSEGVEVMVGVVRDPAIGPLVAFGLGGIDVEVLADVQFALAPLSDRDATALIDRSRASRLMSGHRGRPLGDRAALIELISRISLMADAVQDIAEVDMNPVMVMPAGRGCSLVDVRIRVGRAPAVPGP